MHLRPVLVPAALAASVATGCFGQLPEDDQLAQTVAEIRVIPPGVGCLRMVLRAPGATADTTRNFPVTPGTAASLDLGYLVAGAYSFRPAAYNVACASVTGGTAPSWVGDAETATITPGVLTRLSFTLRPHLATPGSVDFVQPAQAIYAGRSSRSTFAVMQDGTVRAWGANGSGQLGDGTTAPTTTPRVVDGLAGVQQIAATQSFACATTGGGLACWGQYGGALHDGATWSSLTPRLNPGLVPSEIAVANDGICARLGVDLRCWSGSIEYTLESFRRTAAFALIDRDAGYSARPLWYLSGDGVLSRIEPYRDDAPSFIHRPVVAFALGLGLKYCALVPGGAVRCGSTVGEPELVDVPTATSVHAGGSHYCAVTTDRSLWCWGDNLSGQVGVELEAPAVTRPRPVPIADVRQVAMGPAHTCALRGDGSVWCWGSNDYGELGDGTRTVRYSPVRVQF